MKMIQGAERGQFTKGRTARLRKEKTSEANQHRTKVHDYYKLHTETETKQKQKLTKRQESGRMDRSQQKRVREQGR